MRCSYTHRSMPPKSLLRTCRQRLCAVLLLRGLQRGGLRRRAARLVVGALLLPPRLLQERVAAIAQRTLAGQVGLPHPAHPVVHGLTGEGGRGGQAWWAVGGSGGRWIGRGYRMPAILAICH